MDWPQPIFQSESPRISVFPHDQSNWRIDWFGDIAFPDRKARRKQPSVLIQLSRVPDAKYGVGPSAMAPAPSIGAPKQLKRVWVSVGTLVLIRIGDIWRDGRLFARPSYQLENFKGVQISKDTTSLVKAGLNLDEKGFLLPSNEHPWHMQSTQSYCIMVDLPKARRMIVPCVELVRFYFGSSSNLLSALFLPPLARESLFTSASLDPCTRRLRIDLAEKMSGASAADIGRIAMDRVAAYAAKIVGKSCLRASTAGQAVFPQAVFPFEGKTNLVAAGQWLSHGSTPNSTFLVYNLRSCSHPFPFRSLQYTTKGTRPRPKPQNASTSASAAPMQVRSMTSTSQTHALVEEDSSGTLARKTQSIKESARFPDLQRKYIWRDRLLDTLQADDSVIAKASRNIDASAVGDSGSDRRVRPVDLTNFSESKNGQQLIPLFLQDTVKSLQQVSGITVELLTQSHHDGWTVPISVLADEDGEVSPELMLTSNDGGTRMRRVALFAFKKSEEQICAAVIEAEPPYTKIYAVTGQDADEVWATLRCATIDLAKGMQSDTHESKLTDLIYWIFGVTPIDRRSH